jgi:hypothetical protein
MASDLKPDGARLGQREVICIAGEAAAMQGYRLTDYKNPPARCEFNRRDKTWGVFYDGRIPMPGHHSLVWVAMDDADREALWKDIGKIKSRWLQTLRRFVPSMCSGAEFIRLI